MLFFGPTDEWPVPIRILAGVCFALGFWSETSGEGYFRGWVGKSYLSYAQEVRRLKEQIKNGTDADDHRLTTKQEQKINKRINSFEQKMDMHPENPHNMKKEMERQELFLNGGKTKGDPPDSEPTGTTHTGRHT